MNSKALDPDTLQKINAYGRAANYLSVGQIYLNDNPLLKEPLKLSHVKSLLLGHLELESCRNNYRCAACRHFAQAVQEIIKIAFMDGMWAI